MDVVVNERGLNVKIKAHILSDERMRVIGFTDRSQDAWYFEKMLKVKSQAKNNRHKLEISFSVRINKNDENDLRIDVLDEDFLQPYDYQSILERDPKFRLALEVKEQVEGWMKYLQDAGVLSGHVYGEYI